MRKPKPKVYRSVAEIPAHHFVPVAEIMKSYDAEVAWAEKHYGPDVPPLTPRGRPRRGVKTEPSKVHAVRIKESAWQAFCAKAKAAGLTANAALQLALRDWTSRT